MSDPDLIDDGDDRAAAEEVRRGADEERIAVLQERQRAYVRVFVEGNATKDDCTIVTQDLGRFCRAFDSTYDDDPRKAAMLDGRREVYLRILEFARLNTGELFLRYHGRR